ncbi:MAG: LURP-one-related family protein, partial [Longimicrobiales bacterium]
SGNELAFIKQRLLSWGPTYEVFGAGAMIAEVKKELFTFFKCRFTVDVPGPDDLEATGNFLDYEYEFTRGDTVVARVSKQWFAWSDTYGIEVIDSGDALVILTATVVIDAVCHQEERRG